MIRLHNENVHQLLNKISPGTGGIPQGSQMPKKVKFSCFLSNAEKDSVTGGKTDERN